MLRFLPGEYGLGGCADGQDLNVYLARLSVREHVIGHMAGTGQSGRADGRENMSVQP